LILRDGHSNDFAVIIPYVEKRSYLNFRNLLLGRGESGFEVLGNATAEIFNSGCFAAEPFVNTNSLTLE